MHPTPAVPPPSPDGTLPPRGGTGPGGEAHGELLDDGAVAHVADETADLEGVELLEAGHGHLPQLHLADDLLGQGVELPQRVVEIPAPLLQWPQAHSGGTGGEGLGGGGGGGPLPPSLAAWRGQSRRPWVLDDGGRGPRTLPPGVKSRAVGRATRELEWSGRPDATKNIVPVRAWGRGCVL